MELLELVALLDTKSRIFIVVVFLLILDRVGMLDKMFSAMRKIYSDRVKQTEEMFDLKEAKLDMEAQEKATMSSHLWTREQKMFNLLETVVRNDLISINNSLRAMQERDGVRIKLLTELKESNDLLGSRIVYLSDVIRELSGTILLKDMGDTE